MYCSKCGKENDDNAKLCVSCGNALQKDDSNQGTSSESSTNKGKKRRRWFSKWWHWVLSAIGLIIFLVLIFSDLGGSSENTEVINIVKNGVLNEYPSKTLGEAVSGFFGNPKWTSGEDEDGNIYVNVKGRITLQDKNVAAVLQYKVDEQNKTFEFNAFEINEVPQNLLMYMSLLEAMYNNGN